MGLISKVGGTNAEGDVILVPMFDGTWWLVVSVIITMFASMFVQGAEGATFAMIPSIKKADPIIRLNIQENQRVLYLF